MDTENKWSFIDWAAPALRTIKADGELETIEEVKKRLSEVDDG